MNEPILLGRGSDTETYCSQILEGLDEQRKVFTMIVVCSFDFLWLSENKNTNYGGFVILTSTNVYCRVLERWGLQ